MQDELIIKPVYQQIAIDIANRITNGEFEVGEKIKGRSTLASYYNVSPETIRRALALLQDTDIVAVFQGSGILVKSKEEAYRFIEKFKQIDSINTLKSDIANLMEEKRRIDERLDSYINKIVDYSERFKNSNPFASLEIEINKECKILNKTISEVHFWQNTGATIIGIRRESKLILSPGPYAVFREDDTFIVIGDEGTFDRVNAYLYSKKRK